MSDQIVNHAELNIPYSLILWPVTSSIGVLIIVLSAIAYAAIKPGFDLLATHLSDIGASPFGRRCSSIPAW